MSKTLNSGFASHHVHVVQKAVAPKTTVITTVTKTTVTTTTVKTAPLPKSAHNTPWYEWGFVLGLIVLFVFASLYAKRSYARGARRYSFWISLISILAGAVMAGLAAPIKLDWLPESDFFIVRFFGWTALFLLVIRYFWTQFILKDTDGITLGGDHIDLATAEKRYSDVSDAQSAIHGLTVRMLHAVFRDELRAVRNGLTQDKFLGTIWWFLMKLEDEAEEHWDVEFDVSAWKVDGLNRKQVEWKYRKAVWRAINSGQPVSYKGDGQQAQGLVRILTSDTGERVVTIVALKHGVLLNPLHVEQLWVSFNTLLDNPDLLS